jgi:signal peptidase I
MNNVPSKKTSLAKSLGLMFFSVTLVLAFRWLVWEPFVIPSGSMIPTLLINDHIVVSKFTYGVRWPFSQTWAIGPKIPKRGDVVVFRSSENDGIYMIKRVMGLPGDKIQFTEQGQVLINGEPLRSEAQSLGNQFSTIDLRSEGNQFVSQRETLSEREYWTLLDPSTFRYTLAEHVVPEGRIFLMGDNRDHSRDSRFWGDLPIENLRGRAQFVWLSCEKTLSKVQFICDPRSIRWHRFFHRIE